MASGDVKAVVSAGNTGAMVASAMLNNKMFLPGVRRPGIAAIFPSHQGPVVIVDVCQHERQGRGPCISTASWEGSTPSRSWA